jgi:hypothetical protein
MKKMTTTQESQIECGEMMIKGNCTGDSNPDAWFPEMTQGNPSDSKMLALATETRRAIYECYTCPNKDECLEEGMQPKNLSHGIWGGRLAGERILMADERGIKYMVDGRGTGAIYLPDNRERVGKGRYKGTVVIKEDDGVTLQAKRNALRFLNKIRPWIEV